MEERRDSINKYNKCLKKFISYRIKNFIDFDTWGFNLHSQIGWGSIGLEAGKALVLLHKILWTSLKTSEIKLTWDTISDIT